jgi:hypothetical protein
LVGFNVAQDFILFTLGDQSPENMVNIFQNDQVLTSKKLWLQKR